MINPIIMLFLLLSDLGYIELEQILTTNLLLLVICRGLYTITYFFNYNKEPGEDKKLFSKHETIYFTLKQVLLILVGMLYLPIAAFISFYSLMMTGSYLKKIGEERRSRIIEILGTLINILSPILGIFWYIFEEENYVIAAIGISVLVYLYYGLKNSSFSLADLLEKYGKRRLNKLPQLIQYIILIVLIAFPTTIIISAAVYAPPVRQTYMVEMDDGVKLATDVYFAPGSFGAPRPVILIRTPYGKTGWTYSLAKLLYLPQGYHVVIQDMRGTYDSEGGPSFQLFTKSNLDGVDTVEWVRAQSWCNGGIGSSGASALCMNQYYYAGMNPEGLLCQQLWFGTPEMYDHAIYQGSYHKSSVETWIESTAPDNYDYQIGLIFQFHPKNIAMYNSTSLSIELGPHYSNVTVRALHVGGWYDHFLQGTIDGYIGYDDMGATRARGHQKMIIGPWTHVNFQSIKQGELTYPQNSNGYDLVLGWEQEIFDDSLLNITTNWDKERVAYYLMGSVDEESDQWNYWRYAYDWPLDYVNDTWYFNAGEVLSNVSSGTINMKCSYLYNPIDPVPNLGGQNQPFDLCGPMDQRDIENRGDVLLFETENLTEPVETVGRIWGHLYVSSNCTDTDFTIKLTDVYPDGRSMLITDGSLTVRSRKGYLPEDESLMSGNQNDIYELLVDCWSTAYIWAPGHKIRVIISSSNYPRFAANPNTGVPLASNYLTHYIANNTLLIGPTYPSCIILPRLVNVSSTHTVY